MSVDRTIFREYDIRGVYPSDLNEKSIEVIADAISKKCFKENIRSVVVGRDGRNSGQSLLKAFSDRLIKNGINVKNIGLVTSPILYFAAKKKLIKVAL